MNALEPQQPYIVTHRRVLAIAVPMTLAGATTPLIGVVATAVIGRASRRSNKTPSRLCAQISLHVDAPSGGRGRTLSSDASPR
jgi:Na+-driven multidrug efflux pump